MLDSRSYGPKSKKIKHYGNVNSTRATQSVAYPLAKKLDPVTLKINMFPDSLKVWVCTKFGPNLLKDVDSRVFTRMLRGKNLTPWPLTLKINRVPDSPKGYVCTKFGQNPLMLILECSQGCYAVKIWPCDIDLWPWNNRVSNSHKD